MAALQQPSNDDLNNTGVPATLTVRVPRSVSGLFEDGATLLSVNTYTQVTPIAGANVIRLRGKFTCAGTLSFRYRRPPGQPNGPGGNAATAYDASLAPAYADTPVLANTEFLISPIEPIGEPYLAITYAPSGNGAVVFLDVGAA